MRFNKIFGIGLPRTGTTSLHIAFQELGLASVHFPFEFYEQKDFSRLEECDAFSDAPLPLLYRDLDREVLNAGYILTTRGVDDWSRSMEWLLSHGPKIWPWKDSYNEYHRLFFGSAEFDQGLYRKRFEKYHRDVQHYFDRRRSDLLVLDLERGYGYEELCHFLEVDRPNKAYPKSNESRRTSRLHRFAVASHATFPILSRRLLSLEHRLSTIRTRLRDSRRVEQGNNYV